MQIAVIGSADCSDEEYRVAEAVGRLIADNRGIVCCGGLGGVMEAVCRAQRRRAARPSASSAAPETETPTWM